MATTSKVTSWSFSRYADYRKCPALFKFKHLDKLKEPKNDAMQRGIDIHKLAEDYTLGRLKTLPTELKLFKAEFARLRKEKVKMVEDNWAWTASWQAETAWNDWANCWVRIKLDVAYINVEHNALVVIDHKTGKFREDKQGEYDEQNELYGLAGLKKHPDVAVVSPRNWYLDTGKVYPDPEELEVEYFRKDEPLLEKKWAARIKPMFNDNSFKPTPGDACRWCHYRKSNGGPCKF